MLDRVGLFVDILMMGNMLYLDNVYLDILKMENMLYLDNVYLINMLSTFL